MSNQAEARLLSDISHEVASGDTNTFKIVIVSNAHQAGILASILTKNLHIPKQRITQLGYTASDEQNASLLRKQNSIVIVPEPIVVHRPCQFYPQQGANEVVLFQATGEKVQISRHSCSGQPFNLDEIRTGSEARRVGGREGQPEQEVRDEHKENGAQSVKKWWQFWR